MNVECETLNRLISPDNYDEINVGGDFTDNGILDVDEGSTKRSIKVDQVKGAELARFDFLKIDAEGAEPEVIESFEDRLPKK
jgi:hypothetical protein